jgi:hypothetical protein
VEIDDAGPAHLGVVSAARHWIPLNRCWRMRCARSRQRNLRAWCQRCHLAHDRAWHLLQRWITYRLRYARADRLLGPYRHGPPAAVLLSEILAGIADRLAHPRDAEPSRHSPDV